MFYCEDQCSRGLREDGTRGREEKGLTEEKRREGG